MVSRDESAGGGGRVSSLRGLPLVVMKNDGCSMSEGVFIVFSFEKSKKSKIFGSPSCAEVSSWQDLASETIPRRQRLRVSEADQHPSHRG